MKIQKVVLQLLKMPLKEPFETSFGRQLSREVIIVRVISEGITGYGECVALTRPIYNEETTETAWHVMEKFLIPTLLSNTIAHPDEVSALFSFIKRNNMAKAALESAVWDLYSKQQGVSLSTALGGTFKRINVGVSIGLQQSVDELVKRVGGFLQQGYKKIKIKIKPGKDIESIKAIRETFGYDVPLMADANSSYTLDDIELLKALDAYQLMMIEQPLAHDDIVDHATLQAQLLTPICLDESIHSAEDARKAIELGSCGIINIKSGRVGGLTESKKIHDLCVKHHIPVWCGGMLETGIGRAHNIALASLSNFVIPGDTSASSKYWNEDIVQPEITMTEPGKMAVPTEPGFGFQIAEDVFQKYLLHEKTYSM
ncbi:o-succinylbenzoate synthase [Bacillaceae bacterium Marseille-Q3522]|nr:o-succinylbenzoate synthase [Bacillaceae bacterium Marseille-Q3522]